MAIELNETLLMGGLDGAGPPETRVPVEASLIERQAAGMEQWLGRQDQMWRDKAARDREALERDQGVAESRGDTVARTGGDAIAQAGDGAVTATPGRDVKQKPAGNVMQAPPQDPGAIPGRSAVEMPETAASKDVGTSGSEKFEIDLRRAVDAPGRGVGWLMESVIPRGKLTLLTGDAGIGKSFLMLDVAAAVTCGRSEPHALATGFPGDVLLVAGDDDLSDTIRPRLEAAGADLARVHVVTGIRAEGSENQTADDGDSGPAGSPGNAGLNASLSRNRSSRWQLERDLALIESRLERLRHEGLDVQLVVIDPVRSFAGFGVRRQPGIEEIAEELVGLAKRQAVAVVVVSDDCSSPGGNPRLKPLNIALATTARSVWNLVRDLDDPNRRLLLPVKTCLSATSPGWAFSIQDGALQWEPDRVPLSAAGFASQALERKRGRTRSVTAEREVAWALAWLAGQLAARPVSVETLRKDARDCNVTTAMLRRAFFELDCQVMQSPDSGGWFWFLRASRDVLCVETHPGVAEQGDQAAQHARHDKCPADPGLDEVVKRTHPARRATLTKVASADQPAVVQTDGMETPLSALPDRLPLEAVFDDCPVASDLEDRDFDGPDETPSRVTDPGTPGGPSS
jgi:putative DNA primase/helicase